MLPASLLEIRFQPSPLTLRGLLVIILEFHVVVGGRLFASPPVDGLPGEDDPDLLIEVLTEIYGLISEPLGWRQTLLKSFKELGFK